MTTNNIGPIPYGTVFPTTGLYNGYQFTIFMTNPSGGSNAYTTVYRTDLDSTYPWHVTGGVSLMSEVDANESTASASYTALATAGPSITPSRAGVYAIEIGVWTQFSGSNAGDLIMSYDIGGTGATDSDAYRGSASAGGTTVYNAGSRKRMKTLSAASTALVSKYRVPAAATGSFGNRWMAVTPVRLI